MSDIAWFLVIAALVLAVVNSAILLLVLHVLKSHIGIQGASHERRP